MYYRAPCPKTIEGAGLYLFCMGVDRVPNLFFLTQINGFLKDIYRIKSLNLYNCVVDDNQLPVHDPLLDHVVIERSHREVLL